MRERENRKVITRTLLHLVDLAHVLLHGLNVRGPIGGVIQTHTRKQLGLQYKYAVVEPWPKIRRKMRIRTSKREI